MVEITTETATAIIENLQERNKELAKLVNILQEEKRELKGKLAQAEAKVESLEKILQQRSEKTENNFHKNRAKFDQLETMLLRLWDNEPAGTGFTYPEAQRKAFKLFPEIPWTHLDRRFRTLGPKTPEAPNNKGLCWKKKKRCSVTGQMLVAYYRNLESV
jgi:uncharacterized protein YPO0396